MEKRYYKLSNGTTGKPLASYVRNQPNIEGLQYLEEPQDKYNTIWNGSEWEFNLSEYKLLKLNALEDKIKNNWLKINKTLDEIKTQYINFKTNSVNWTSRASVDVAYDNAIIWLDL